ncbi:MAG: tRNA pseudouridine(13) synthase TruD [Phycisphaerales bacterium]
MKDGDQTTIQPDGPCFADPVALTDGQYVTKEFPGVAGELKQRDEDFLVDEQPLYQPSGEGEHIYLCVEKQGLSTTEMVRVLADHFKVRESDVGFAGMKDKHAITRQIVSVHTPGKTDADFPMLEHPRVRILWTDLHQNKLRVGHLRANRFSVRLRDADPTKVVTVKRVLDALVSRGVPNYYGEQRFGARLNNHELGQLLLTRSYQRLLDVFLGPDELVERFRDDEARALYARGDYEGALRRTHDGMRNERAALAALARGSDAETAVFSVPKLQRRFWISAFQSWLFNRFVADRVSSGTLDRLLDGDVACRVPSGRPFLIDRETSEDPETARRLASFELSCAGPMFGARMLRSSHETARYEDALLAGTGVTIEDLAEFDGEQGGAPGTRRAIRVPLMDPEVEAGVDEHGGYIRVAFELPPGSFATVVVREITKRHPLPEIARARLDAWSREVGR